MRKSRDRKGTASATLADTRRRWTAEEKAQLVRQHLRDGVVVAALAEQSRAGPRRA